jgi:lipoprotein-anchoring transpeptidase ErfK/SrfK
MMSDRKSVTFGVILCCVGLAFILVGLSGCTAKVTIEHHPDATSAATPTASGRTVATATVKSIQIFNKPYAPQSERRLANPNSEGAPLVFLVKSEQVGWYQVLLPVPPNQSVGWIRSSDVKTSVTPYRVEVRTHSHRLLVYRDATRLINERAGVGTSDTPTPGGEYYLTELLQTHSPAGPYGPYAYGLSGQSTTLKSFNGYAPVLGIHGTNDPSHLGKDVSHGCVRVSNATITKLAKLLPLGTPVVITAN